MKLSAIVILGLSMLGANAYAADTETTTQTTTTQAQTSDAKNTGQAFLAANKKKPGVITLADGLQYKVLTAGTGEKPTDTDLVTVDYAGTLVDGTEFDSSYKRGEPATFPVAGVIPGWTEALKLMKVGSTWELYIPSALAYGTDGAPPMIGPDQTLIFKVKLISINKS
jgi:FKBP-type peptidyl-prolyl cis-trans isomerase FklB